MRMLGGRSVAGADFALPAFLLLKQIVDLIMS